MPQVQEKIAKRTINHIVEVDKFPTLPSVAMEAIRLMEGEHSSFDSIADLLKSDQVLASKILHYANTAFVGARSRVTSISQAISVLGFNAVRVIILSVSIFDCFKGQLARHKRNLVNFWLHSIGVAATAELLAKKLGFPSPDEAYIAGLVHDLGKLASYIESPGKFEKVCQELDLQGTYGAHQSLPLDIEKNILGTSHIETGKMLASRWGLPESLVRVMWLHHQPVFETITPEENNLPKLIRFADVLCVIHNVGASYFLTAGPYSHEHFHFALDNLMLHHHISPEDIDEIMEDVHKRVQEISDVLGIWDEKTYRKLVSSANVSLGGLGMQLEKSNQELLRTNQVFEAICEMTRKLKPNLALPEAAKVVVNSALKAFGVNRCLCMIRDEASQKFVGKFCDNGTYQNVDIPAHVTGIKKYSEKVVGSDIELEAAQRLERTAIDLSQGATLESGMIDMVVGSQFLATFFIATRQYYHGEEPILGELIVDFADVENFPGDERKNVTRYFETFSLAAGNAVEGVLLQNELARHAREMEETSRKMEESQRQLFHSHRLATVGRLAAGAAHEINNPLTIISLNVQIILSLLGGKKENKEIRDRLKVVTEQEERISKIIQDLMGFARPTQPKFHQASISLIMDKVLSVIGDRVSMAKVEVQNAIGLDLPQVMVDSLQMEQVFMNILINANHAMPEGGEIKLNAKAVNGSVEVSIADTGEGIPKKDLAKIFDPFFTTKKEGEGTGLGLAICHSIVEHNGGSLRVVSEEGKGTIFTVILPVDKGSRLRAMKKSIEQKRKGVSRVKQEKYRILVIDDEKILNEMLQESLKAVGYIVDGAYDGVEGIGFLRYNKYDVVLLDIRMPRKDGLEVLKFIKEAYPDIKVIIITGLASKEEVKETVKHGAFACLKKPFRLEKVLQTIEQALESKNEDKKRKEK